jgi:hypothetical protein
MTFRVGQKVVCIRHRDGAGRPGANYPKVGPIYTVRSINDGPKGAIICLEEIDNAHLIPAHGPIEPGFIASAFRPIVENKKPISFTMGADPDSESWDNRKHAKEKV